MSQRLFLAIPIPKTVRERIAEELFPILQAFEKRIRIVPAKNLHLTLRFLGNWPDEEMPELLLKLRSLGRQTGFKIQLEKTGSFQDRVAWAGIEKGKEELEKMAGIVSQALGLEKEPFKSHLTLARNKNLPAAEWKKMLEKLQEKRFTAVFKAESVHLMQSHLKPSGSEYESVFEWKLKGTGNEKERE
jgi:2'-5' RNA ligase